MVQIKDVAERAGVSTATVSRVLNGKSVRPHFREAVERSVRELGYRPDRQARQLRLQRSDEVALILPDIENPFYTGVARGVIDVTRAAGYATGLWNSDDLSDKEETYLEAVRDAKLAGIIIAPSTPSPRIDDLLADKRAVVAVDRSVDVPVDSAILDHRGLAVRGTADLVSRGYRRIACITGPTTSRTAEDRTDGWRREMRRHKLSTRGLLRRGNAHVDGGRAATAELMALAEPPDAILAANNLIGVGALQALDELGDRSVGLSVIGDLPFATSRPPTATIIPLSPRELGEQAARMLIERIDGLAEPPRTVVQPVAEPEPLGWR